MGILFGARPLLYESRMAVRLVRLSVLSLSFAAFACSEADPTPLQPGDASASPDRMITPVPDGGQGPVDGGDPEDAGRTDSGNDPFDPLCESCRDDGQTCELSFNCHPGSICNTPDEDFYDPNQPEGVCIRVICDDDTDCLAPKVCTERKICESPVCQDDDQCPENTVCKGGACTDIELAGAASSCIILTRSQPLATGTAILLEALVLDANGEALRGPVLDWSSSDAAIVRISGDAAIGDMNEGAAQISATVRDNATVQCSGLTLRNYLAVPANNIRIFALAENDLSAISGADVYFGDSSAPVGVTGADGVMLTTVPLPTPNSVTVIKNGFHAVTVFVDDPTDQLLILSPRAPDRTVAGGIRGVVDISSLPDEDLPMGVGGTARDMNVLGHGVLPSEPDIIPTLINAPELSLNNELVEMPGNYLVGLGNRQFTADETHCQGVVPGVGELGCYLLRAPAGPTTPYIFAGSLRLSQVTAIANELSGALGQGPASYRLLLSVISPIIPFLNHGARPYVQVTEVPVGPEGVPDYANYRREDMRARYPQNIFSRVTSPTFPTHNGMCPEAAELTVFSIAHGRGLIPLGVRVAKDVVETESPNCRPGPIARPFGDTSPNTVEGEIPISVAPRHSGLEGGRLLLALSAIDIEVDAAGERRQSTLYKHVESLNASDAINTAFLPFPVASISRQSSSVSLTNPPSAMITGTRITIERGDEKWIVHTALPSGSVHLPGIMPLNMLLLASDRALVQTYSADATYQELFSLGSGKTFVDLVENVRAVSGQEATLAN